MSKENEVTAKMLFEMNTDKELYLTNCKSSYSLYLFAAQKLFKGVYTQLEKIKPGQDAYSLYNSKSEKLKRKKDFEAEQAVLEKAVQNLVETPGTYERLAILYSKNKRYNDAYSVCKKWFETDYWKLPNTATTSLKILRRRKRLENKLNLI